MRVMVGLSPSIGRLPAGRSEGWDEINHLWDGLNEGGKEVIILEETDEQIPFSAYWGKQKMSLKELAPMLCWFCVGFFLTLISVFSVCFCCLFADLNSFVLPGAKNNVK